MRHISDDIVYDYEVSIYADYHGFAFDIKKNDFIGKVIEGYYGMHSIRQCKIEALKIINRML